MSLKKNALYEFWSNLEGNVHPQDQYVFEKYPNHGFNLDYPPPAFLGNLEEARVFVLMNNGGLSEETKAEFPNKSKIESYKKSLSTPITPGSSDLAPYYMRSWYSHYLTKGDLAIVNAVGYRSIDSNSLNVKKIAKELPSANFHRRWLHDCLISLAKNDEIAVIFHRTTLWQVKGTQFSDTKNVFVSKNPASPHLAQEAKKFITSFIYR